MGNLLKHGVDMYKKTISLKDIPKDASGLLKTSKSPDRQPDFLTSATKQKKSKYQRVAKFLILIGSEQASEVLAELDPDQITEISREIAQIGTIPQNERDEILAEFHALFSKPYVFGGSSKGGIEAARKILYTAKGQEKGEAILNRAVPDSRLNVFTFLEDFSPEQLVLFLKEETDQTAALILARISNKLSAGTISKLPKNRKPEILRRIAHQGEILPEVLEQVSLAFKEKVRHISGGAKDLKIDGMQTLAAILKHGDYSFGDRLINELEFDDPDIARDLKDKIFTIDDVINTVDRSVQDRLKIMTEKEIAILLKGRSLEFNEKILSNVSAGRRQIIREEYEVLGAVPKRDCDAAARDFLTWFRLAREKGEIILFNDEDIL